MPRKTQVGDEMMSIKIIASMRPRPDAAENGRIIAPRPQPEGSFNEAAARCRGKQPHFRPADTAAGVASMRPRPDAAENLKSSTNFSSSIQLLQ